MERRALYVVLFTVLVVALVASVVFLNGNNAQQNNANTNAPKGNSTGVPVNANLTQPIVLANLTNSNSTAVQNNSTLSNSSSN